jgi:hypothetical protein
LADVFISYKSDRRAAAQHLARILELNGYSVWFDYGLFSGSDFGRQIEREIRAAKVILVLWCSRSRDSPWVIEEAHLADKLGTFTPAWLERVDPPLGFARADTIDLSTWDGAPRSYRLDRLFNEIARRVGRDPVPQFRGLQEYEQTWRSFGAPSLTRFALAAPVADCEANRLPDSPPDASPVPPPGPLPMPTPAPPTERGHAPPHDERLWRDYLAAKTVWDLERVKCEVVVLIEQYPTDVSARQLLGKVEAAIRSENARSLAESGVAACVPAAADATASAPAPQSAPPLPLWRDALRYFVTPLVVLLAAHYAIVNAFNLNTDYLWLASVLVPFAAGLALYLIGGRGASAAAGFALALALVGVSGMTLSESLYSGEPILPQSHFEWLDNFQFAAAIALSLLAGHLVARLFRAALTRRPGKSPAPSDEISPALMASSKSGE